MRYYLRWFDDHTSLDLQTSRVRLHWDFRIGFFAYHLVYVVKDDRFYSINMIDYATDPTDDVGVPVWGY